MWNLGPGIVVYALVVAVLLGLVMGSFINCWAWRYVHGESIVRGRSHCTSCGHDLSARDLMPVLSWLFTHGSCRYCGEKVSARYPATEIICAVAFASIVAVYGFSIETVELLAFAGILLFLSLVDIDERIIPNGCILAALAMRIVYLAVSCATGTMDLSHVGYFVASGVGMGAVLVIIVLIADRVFKRESMGGGDLKLYAVAGFYFGWQQGLFLVIVSCIIGIIVAVLSGGQSDAASEREASDQEQVQRRERGHESGSGLEQEQEQEPELEQEPEPGESFLRRTIPFGPSIAAACIVTMLVGNPFISWYLSLLT